MFAPWCPTCDRRMLLGPRRLVRLDQTPAGPVATLRCFCSTALTWPEVASAASSTTGPDPVEPGAAADAAEPRTRVDVRPPVDTRARVVA